MERLESTLTVGAKGWPDIARKRVQRALSRFWNIAFDLPLDNTLPTLSQATDALYDHCGPPDLRTYAALLADLSCSNNEYVAESIVRRADIDEPRILLQALLNKAASETCPKLAEVVEKNRKELEQITQPAK